MMRVEIGFAEPRESVEKRSLVRSQFARFVDQHDRHAVADGIGEARGVADQFLASAVVAQRLARLRADEDFEQFWVHVTHDLGLIALAAVRDHRRRPIRATQSAQRSDLPA